MAAAVELAEVGRIEPGPKITVEKHPPNLGMGMGGGSSDAPTALLGLNRLWGLGLSIDDLAPIAAKLGSDVSFFLFGGTALAQGKGEQVTKLTGLPPRQSL
ncbi:MAG: hypothetical protein CM1200mP22_28520 [Dehalococcoidia bacterium]|nr:MAG: hypothetical protein CM1200mP22_28520 [Dehalococcoidia bacterium]